METNMVFGIAAIGLLIWGFALMYIIRAANDTTKRDKIQLQNQHLLALIAEKLGVEIQEIKNVVDPI